MLAGRMRYAITIRRRAVVPGDPGGRAASIRSAARASPKAHDALTFEMDLSLGADQAGVKSCGPRRS